MREEVVQGSKEQVRWRSHGVTHFHAGKFTSAKGRWCFRQLSNKHRQAEPEERKKGIEKGGKSQRVVNREGKRGESWKRCTH